MLETYGLTEDYFEKNLYDIIHITTEDILRIANEYLHPEEMIDIVAGKKI